MIRRVVTGLDSSGTPRIVSDGHPPRAHEFAALQGFASALVWATDPTVSPRAVDPTLEVESFVPGPGATRLMFTTLPPDAQRYSMEFDGAALAAEHLTFSPGLAHRFEPGGMHRTPTVDYVIVIDGEVVLDLDNGESTRLTTGDVVVQNATRHAWRNLAIKPAQLLAVLVGVDVSSADGGWK